MTWVDSVIADLELHDASDELLAHYRRRRALLAGYLEPAGGPVASSGAAPRVAAVPAPSLREFLSENSILIVSYFGAFLLIVATVLFELYGGTDMPGSVRFGAILVLDIAFGAAGWACLRSRRLRLVGQTYVAIFALMVPLAGLAGYVFLDLGEQGVTQDQALGAIGFASAAVYAALGWRLRSRAYAVLSLTALPIGTVGVADAVLVFDWRPVGFSLLVPIYIAIAHVGHRQDPFARVAEPFIHIAAGLAVPAAFGTAVFSHFAESGYSSTPDPFSWPVAATLAVIGAGYGMYSVLTRRSPALAVVAMAATLAALSASDALHFGQGGAAIVLLAGCAAYAAGGELARHSALRVLLFIGLCAQGLAILLTDVGSDSAEAALLLAVTAVTVGLAIWSRSATWLLLAAIQFAATWYWLAKATLPPPPNPGPHDLLIVYSPLPIVFGIAALVVRLGRGRGWAWPLYVAGAAAAVLVAFAAGAVPDAELAGRALLAYAVVAYAIGSIERSWVGHAAAISTAGLGLVALLIARSAEPILYAAAAGAFFVAAYTTRYVWRLAGARDDVQQAHRWIGAAGLAVTVVGCFAVPNFTDPGSPGAWVSLAVLFAFAAMLVVDGRVHHVPVLDYAAGVVAAVGTYWVDRYLGVTNAQLYAVAPGGVLVIAGLMLPYDRRIHKARAYAPWAAGAGAALLIGTSMVQSLPADPWAWTYIALAVGESVLCMAIGIGTRSRALVIAGGTGAGLAALRAIFLLVQQGVALFIVFGAAALLLLAAGAALAVLRDRLRARTHFPPGRTGTEAGSLLPPK